MTRSFRKLGHCLHLEFRSTHFYNWMLSIIGKSHVVLVIRGSLCRCGRVKRTHQSYFSSEHEIVMLIGRWWRLNCVHLLKLFGTSPTLSSFVESATKSHLKAALLHKYTPIHITCKVHLNHQQFLINRLSRTLWLWLRIDRNRKAFCIIMDASIL